MRSWIRQKDYNSTEVVSRLNPGVQVRDLNAEMRVCSRLVHTRLPGK
jgi:hypothetical protein